MTEKVYGYIRVSSRDQNPGRQFESLKFAGVPAENIYSDKASGKNFERSEYNKLKKRLLRGDILIIKSIDRLGRNYDEIISEWKSITKETGAYIKVVDLPLLDTTSSGRDLTGTFISDIVLQILSYVAEQERLNIRQRQAEGIALAKSQGKHLGRPRTAKPDNFDVISNRWRNKEISLGDALSILGLKRSTFYKMLKTKNTE